MSIVLNSKSLTSVFARRGRRRLRLRLIAALIEWRMGASYSRSLVHGHWFDSLPAEPRLIRILHGPQVMAALLPIN